MIEVSRKAIWVHQTRRRKKILATKMDFIIWDMNAKMCATLFQYEPYYESKDWDFWAWCE